MRVLSRAIPLALRSRLRPFRTLIDEIMKFGVVGAVNVGVNLVVFLALAATVFSDGELKATVVAVVVATTSSYLMNRHWTFRHRPRSTVRREYPLFFLLNGAGLAIELAVLGLVKYGFGVTSLTLLTLAKIAGIGLGTIFRFWTYRTFVFAAPRGAADEAASEPAPEAALPAAQRTQESGPAARRPSPAVEPAQLG